MLVNSGYKICGVASNGEDAVNLYKNLKIPPDIIIMDYNMPIKDGIEATREILQINNNVKIIFSSGEFKIKEIALSAGAVSFLTKPFKFEILINSINDVLRT